MEPKEATIAQRSGKKVFFEHREMDYYLTWVMGREVFDGSDREECLAAAARITDGDVASWQAEWAQLAEKVEVQADLALEQGDLEAARKAYLRACTYYRAPLFIMDPADSRFFPLWEKMHLSFRRAAELFFPRIESIWVPFEGKLLQGYFWKVDDSGAARPTLIVVGGIETFAEDCYFMVGPYGSRRGYNVLAVDLPGQGVNPVQGLHFEARMEVPVQAVVDYALAHPEIDPERLALYGFSWGGHIVFKTAEHEPRIGALIANPAMPDVFRAVLAQQEGSHGRSDPVARTAFQQIAWRFGLQINLQLPDLVRRFGKAVDYLRYGKADVRRIQMPALLIAGEGEAQITLDIAHETYRQLPHPEKKLVIFTAEEGGEAHCQVDNLLLPNRLMFDWLEGVFQ